MAVGMTLLIAGAEPSFRTAPNPPLGNVLAAASGLTWALTVLGLRWVSRDRDAQGGIATVAIGNILAAIGTLPIALPLPAMSAADAAIILYLGIFQIGLAYVCLTRAIHYVPAFEVSVIILIEPVLNPIWTWLVHGERVGAWALAGGAIILIAAAVNSWSAR
jgi:drug/metabolite transporter (DMT)-like permease